MGALTKLLRRIDRMQQGQPFLGYAIGAYKKFSDDQAGYLAALVSYYAFVSIFPLLLVAFTVLKLVLRGRPKLQHKLIYSSLRQYPAITQFLMSSHHQTSVAGAGIALAVGLLLTFYGARGLAQAIQNALNKTWGVPYARRPGFPKSLLRSFGLIIVIGVGQIVTVALSGLASTGHILPGPFAKAGAFAVAALLNAGVFWLAFRVGTAKEITGRDLRLGGIIAGVVSTVLQTFGSVLITHASKSSPGYGVFSVVLGLLAVFYLQAELTLYAAEFNVVRVRKLWPRSLFPPPLTEADVHAYQMYAAAEQRRKQLVVELRRTDDPGGGPGAATAAGEPRPASDADDAGRPGGPAAPGRRGRGRRAAAVAPARASGGAPQPARFQAVSELLSVVAVAQALKRRRNERR